MVTCWLRLTLRVSGFNFGNVRLILLDVLDEVPLVGEGLVAVGAGGQRLPPLLHLPRILLCPPLLLLSSPLLFFPRAPIDGTRWWSVQLLRGLEPLHHHPHLLGPGLLLQPAEAVSLILVLAQEREGTDASLKIVKRLRYRKSYA